MPTEIHNSFLNICVIWTEFPINLRLRDFRILMQEAVDEAFDTVEPFLWCRKVKQIIYGKDSRSMEHALGTVVHQNVQYQHQTLPSAPFSVPLYWRRCHDTS